MLYKDLRLDEGMFDFLKSDKQLQHASTKREQKQLALQRSLKKTSREQELEDKYGVPIRNKAEAINAFETDPRRLAHHAELRAAEAKAEKVKLNTQDVIDTLKSSMFGSSSDAKIAQVLKAIPDIGSLTSPDAVRKAISIWHSLP